MADIELQCEKCEHEMKVSEYVSDDTVSCPSCGEEIAITREEKKVSLKLKKDGEGAAGMLTESAMPVAEPEEGEEPIAVIDPVNVANVLKNVHKARSKTKSPKAWLGWFSFAFVAGIMITMQHMGQTNAAILEHYETVRLIMGPAIYITVIIASLQDGYLQCALCVLIPPYIIFYSLSRLESAVVAGAMIGLILSMGTEIYFMSDNSALLIAQDGLLVFIDDISNWIEAAGDAPDRI